MIVINRRPGQAIIIGETEVLLDRSSANRVRLLINAPPHVKVVRKELLDPPEKKPCGCGGTKPK